MFTVTLILLKSNPRKRIRFIYGYRPSRTNTHTDTNLHIAQDHHLPFNLLLGPSAEQHHLDSYVDSSPSELQGALLDYAAPSRTQNMPQLHLGLVNEEIRVYVQPDVFLSLRRFKGAWGRPYSVAKGFPVVERGGQQTEPNHASHT